MNYVFVSAPVSIPNTQPVPMGNDLMDLLGGSPINNQMNGGNGKFYLTWGRVRFHVSQSLAEMCIWFDNHLIG